MNVIRKRCKWARQPKMTETLISVLAFTVYLIKGTCFEVWTCVSAEANNESAHSQYMSRLMTKPIKSLWAQRRVFVVRMKKAWVLSYPLSVQRRLWSDWADAQPDLSLRWAHTHFVGFVIRRLILFSSNMNTFCPSWVLKYWQADRTICEPRHDKTNKMRSAPSDQSRRCALNG